VDWENSGWGDPAFELADMLAHPAYVTVAKDERARLLESACTPLVDPTFGVRIRTYECLMLIWWTARFARALYEVPRGLDHRLAARSDAWEAETRTMLERYIARVNMELVR
jgi:aminoglycoside phosphotransferase (APT) family kinase protein